MKDFLKEYIDIKPGEIREVESEKVLGYHEGAVFYTIGQRHGLYLSGEKGAVNDGMPYYVVKKDLKNNVVYVSKNLNDENLWTDELKLKDILLRQLEHGFLGDGSLAPVVTGLAPSSSVVTSACPQKASSQLPAKRLLVRLRHRAPLIPARFDGETLHFENKIKRPASGQSAVFYDDEICLGGGIIA